MNCLPSPRDVFTNLVLQLLVLVLFLFVFAVYSILYFHQFLILLILIIINIITILISLLWQYEYEPTWWNFTMWLWLWDRETVFELNWNLNLQNASDLTAPPVEHNAVSFPAFLQSGLKMPQTGWSFENWNSHQSEPPLDCWNYQYAVPAIKKNIKKIQYPQSANTVNIT